LILEKINVVRLVVFHMCSFWYGSQLPVKSAPAKAAQPTPTSVDSDEDEEDDGDEDESDDEKVCLLFCRMMLNCGC
jgi:hypothetical protein